MDSWPALDLRYVPGPASTALQELLHAALDDFQPQAIAEHETADGWRVLAFLPGLLGGADLVHGNSIIRYGTGKTEMTTPYQANMKELLGANFVGINTVVARKSALLAVGGFKPGMRYLEDYELWCRLMHAGYKFKYVKGVFGIYIIHPGNLEKSFKPDEEKWKSLLLEEYTRIPDRMALPGYRTLSLRGAN